MKKLTCLLDFDMFGTVPSLYIGGKDFYATTFGFFISVLVLLGIGVCSIYFIIEMFDTQNVTSFTSVQNPSTPLAINFTSDKFYFGLGIQDPETYEFILDESIYSIKATYKVAEREKNGTLTWKESPVEIEPCQLGNFPQNYRELFSRRSVEKMYCVKNFEYRIEGTFLHDKYSLIMFDFYQCENKTSNNKCKSKEEIEYYLNGTFVAVEFTDVSFDPSNYSNPDSPIIGETYSTVSNSFFREMHLFLKGVEFRSDRGLVFSSIKSKEYIQLDYLQDMFTLKTKENFCSFTLKISNRIDVYERSYTKFQTTLANIGGIVKAITVIGQIFTHLYSRATFNLDMANKLFNIETKQTNNNTNTNFQVSTQNLPKIPLDSTVNINMMDQNNIKNNKLIPINNNYIRTIKQRDNTNTQIQNVPTKDTKFQYSTSFRSDQKPITTEMILNYKKKKIKPLRLSLQEKLLLDLCPKIYRKRTNVMLLKQARELIKEKLDVIFLVREFFNFSRMRNLIFSDDQNTLFNLTHKPKLSVKSSAEKRKSRLELIEIKEEYIDCLTPQIKKAFDNVNKGKSNSLIKDNDFLKCIDPAMKDLLSE